MGPTTVPVDQLPRLHPPFSDSFAPPRGSTKWTGSEEEEGTLILRTVHVGIHTLEICTIRDASFSSDFLFFSFVTNGGRGDCLERLPGRSRQADGGGGGGGRWLRSACRLAYRSAGLIQRIAMREPGLAHLRGAVGVRLQRGLVLISPERRSSAGVRRRIRAAAAARSAPSAPSSGADHQPSRALAEDGRLGWGGDSNGDRGGRSGRDGRRSFFGMTEATAKFRAALLARATATILPKAVGFSFLFERQLLQFTLLHVTNEARSGLHSCDQFHEKTR